jgi:hypothetical protein
MGCNGSSALGVSEASDQRAKGKALPPSNFEEHKDERLTMEGLDHVICSAILRLESERVTDALKDPALVKAVDLVRSISSYTTEDLMDWAKSKGLEEVTSVLFFPLRREGTAQSVTVCLALPEGAEELRKLGYEVLQRYQLNFLPLDAFEWGRPSHALFVQDRLFDLAAQKLQKVAHCLEHLTMFKGNGLLLKYHVPQPELPDGSQNPHASAVAVWTVSIMDRKPPEVLKIGMRHDWVIVAPWNPMAPDVCRTAEEFQGDWATIKNADMGACHFILGHKASKQR